MVPEFQIVGALASNAGFPTKITTVSYFLPQQTRPQLRQNSWFKFEVIVKEFEINVFKVWNQYLDSLKSMSSEFEISILGVWNQ